MIHNKCFRIDWKQLIPTSDLNPIKLLKIRMSATIVIDWNRLFSYKIYDAVHKSLMIDNYE